MSNAHRGSVTVEANGRTYTLVLGVNAICELEDLLSTPDKAVTIQNVLNEVARSSVRHIRALMWAALRAHQPEMTLEQAGEFIDAAQEQLPRVIKSLMSSLNPDPKDAKALGVNRTRPPKAQVHAAAGTGDHSRSMPAPVV